ncbi:MAG: histidine phosphatase family protein [Deltaproteobacteria bacterium]|nr:histidine phosphatase family protein [Deltaproteobacteria bacterium]
MRRLILLRHASAEDARDDALRELSVRGRREAASAGERIAALGAGWAPTHALCSTALRASATLELAQAALPALREVDFSARLYLASAGELLSAVNRAPDADACLLVVAHQPGLGELVRQLMRRAAPEARAGLARGLTPGAFAALELDVARWEAAMPTCAELVAFVQP